jgi:hypothetical protein
MSIDPNLRMTLWDKKSTYRLIFVLLILFTIFYLLFFYPSELRDKKVDAYNGYTTGTVLSIEENNLLSQNFDGQHTLTISYNVTFIYKVNGKTYSNTNVIDNSGKYKKLIKNIFLSNYTKKIDIKYDITNPQESMIMIE